MLVEPVGEPVALETMKTRAEAIAQLLATALDRENYTTALQLLAEDCVYLFRGERIEDPAKIISMYQSNGDAGRETYDEIHYVSRVEPQGNGKARIHYTDSITLKGETHVHRCLQEIAVDDGGKVARIVHVDLEGEAERLSAFNNRHGISKGEGEV